MFRVTMQFGGKAVRKYTFDKDVVAIGREAGCDIMVDNIGASRRHCTIEKTDEGYVLTDLKSHNGTFVNGEKIFHHVLSEADEFFIGKYAFGFEVLEPVVECGDGVPEEAAAAPAADMTFRLDRKDIERIIGTSSRGTAPQLVQVAPEGVSYKTSLEKAYHIIGKDEGCEVPVRGFFIPGKAAVILKGDHGFRVLGLSKKFRLNGEPISDSPLKDGDLLQIGPYRYRFCQA